MATSTLPTPRIAPSAVVLPGAVVVGNVTLDDDCSIWYNSVVRAEEGSVAVGARTNVQDGCILHVDAYKELIIGSDVTVGHGCVLHGCTVRNGALVGIGSVVMDGAVLGEGCVVGAGSLVTGGTEIPAGMLAIGRPAKPVRPVRNDEREHFAARCAKYVQESKNHAALYK